MKKNKQPKNRNQQILMFVFLVFLSLIISCKNKNVEDSREGLDSLPEEKNIVDTMVIHTQDFTREIKSNGKLSATQSAELWFKNSGIVKDVLVKNGQTVSSGNVLAQLLDDDIRFAYNKAKISMEEAELKRLSRLMELGYKDGPDNVPPDRLKIAEIQSGYSQTSINFQEAEQALKNAVLTAPFTGKVEGVSQKPFERADQSKPFCTLINDNRFTIDFPLMETEYGKVSVGQKVTVSPIALNKPTTGTVTEINPRVDENGLVWVKAEVENPGGYIEGMNVKVSIKNSVPNQLVVPKQSMVLRQNREVLFRYTTEGTAYWTYINVLDENETQYSVKAAEGATLASGDTIIISNNLNLAHNSEVEVGN